MKKNIFLGVIAILFVFSLGAYAFRGEIRDAYENFQKRNLPEAKDAAELNESQASALSKKTSALDLPAEINLNVPFVPQAPYGDWSLPYKEACEEASAILVHYFYTGKPMTPAVMDAEILKLVEWQKKNFGFYIDTNASQTAEMLRQYFGYKKVVVKYDITASDIKRELAAGRPVIMPFAGQKLGNPYFRRPGPIYHMLVVKGYTKDGKFITNDVGTRRGKDYVYDAEVLLKAAHDWTDFEIMKGRRAMIVVFPNAESASTKGE